eukprot:TRINITY_DN43699_c0_g1_i1.p1 TRINITY_DN43699_c0_g1~~TRINITY_DN43699_c0_g1_i1.p1  ORF type:complete len:509 (-),score=73.37 TRINITY_DN43699_c0_g1_i1:72-1559(-)
MVLLARRVMQERALSRSREATSGEGIDKGSRVAVLNGRHFPSFSGGDQGQVIRVDHDAMNCDVLFDGRAQAIPVALRHLRLVRPNSTLGALRSRSRSSSVSPTRSAQPGSHGHEHSEGRSLSRGRLEFGAASSQCTAKGSADASLIGTREKEREQRSKLKQTPRGGTGESEILGRLEKRLIACEAALGSHSVPTTPRKAVAVKDASASSPSSQCTVLDSDAATIAALKERLQALQEQQQALQLKYQTDTELLKKQLQEAVAFGQAQEARANSLEKQVIASGGAGTATAVAGSGPTKAPHASWSVSSASKEGALPATHLSASLLTQPIGPSVRPATTSTLSSEMHDHASGVILRSGSARRSLSASAASGHGRRYLIAQPSGAPSAVAAPVVSPRHCASQSVAEPVVLPAAASTLPPTSAVPVHGSLLAPQGSLGSDTLDPLRSYTLGLSACSASSNSLSLSPAATIPRLGVPGLATPRRLSPGRIRPPMALGKGLS